MILIKSKRESKCKCKYQRVINKIIIKKSVTTYKIYIQKIKIKVILNKK